MHILIIAPSIQDARKMKSDGYMVPNEQMSNPISAFESSHIVDFARQISDGMVYVGRNQVTFPKSTPGHDDSNSTSSIEN